MNDQDFDFRRKHERKSYNADIVFASKTNAYSGIMKNISLGGAFIVTSHVNQVSVGDVITVNIPFRDSKKSVKRKARIEWQNNEGFAVEFF